MENNSKYYDTFYGHKVSDYALKYGRLDYRTLAQCFDCVLCNNITEVDPYIFDHIESGDFEEFYYDGEEITREDFEHRRETIEDRLSDLYFAQGDDLNEKQKAKLEKKIKELEEEQDKLTSNPKDIFQWFLVDGRCALDLLREAGELVLYSEALDCYVWGVDHWGTSWDYVLTNIELKKRED